MNWIQPILILWNKWNIGNSNKKAVVVLSIFYSFVMISDAGSKSNGKKVTFKQTLKVSIVELEPYVMVKPTYGKGGYIVNTTTPTYEGYMIDLIAEMAKLIGFKYSLVREPENRYGHRNKDGSWDGIIGAVKNKEVDIGAAPLFITEHRLKAVDFTEPFLDVTATLLLRKPPAGQDIPISSVRELVKQSEIKYGTLDAGLIPYSFRNSNESLYKIMYRKMQRFKPSVMTSTNEEGISRVRREKYAFVIPSTIGDYISRRKPCDLLTVDSFLMDRGFGLAVRRKSPILDELNRGIAQLRDSGFLDRLYFKWWIANGECSDIKSSKVFSFNKATSGWSIPCVIFQLLGLSTFSLLVH